MPVFAWKRSVIFSFLKLSFTCLDGWWPSFDLNCYSKGSWHHFIPSYILPLFSKDERGRYDAGHLQLHKLDLGLLSPFLTEVHFFNKHKLSYLLRKKCGYASFAKRELRLGWPLSLKVCVRKFVLLLYHCVLALQYLRSTEFHGMYDNRTTIMTCMELPLLCVPFCRLHVLSWEDIANLMTSRWFGLPTPIKIC